MADLRYELVGMVFIAGLFLSIAFFSEPSLTGRVIGEEFSEGLIIDVEDTVSSDSDLSVTLPSHGRIRAVRVSGSGIVNDQLTVSIDGQSFVIDRPQGVRPSPLTGLVVGSVDPPDDARSESPGPDPAPSDDIDLPDPDLAGDASADEGLAPSVPDDPEEESRSNRTILRYGNGPYDVDNDGSVGPRDAIDFFVESEAACILWSIASESASLFCRGDASCCRELGFVETAGDPANELVLTRDSAGVTGSVLAREPDASFSEQLLFSFAGAPERFVSLDRSCGEVCDVRTSGSELTFSVGSGQFTIDRIEVVFEPVAISDDALEAYVVVETDEGMITGRASDILDGFAFELGARGVGVARHGSDPVDVALVNTSQRYGGELPFRYVRVAADVLRSLDETPQRVILRTSTGLESRILTRSAFDELASFGEFEEAYLDRPVALLTEPSLAAISYPEIRSGSGVRVCIVDTGVAPSLIAEHEVISVNVLTESDDVIDGHGHGSNVAYPLLRALPDATFIIVKAVQDSGEAFESDVLTGLDACEAHGADVISLSLGSGAYTGYCDGNLVASRVNRLVTDGALVVAAAGNDGVSVIKSPSCASHALAVIASDGDTLWSDTSRLAGHAVLAAPGVSIETRDATASTVFADGTSMSVPFVSAAGAVLIEEANETGLSLRNRLVYTADVLNDSGVVFGRVNVTRALLGEVTNLLLYELDQGPIIDDDAFSLLSCTPPTTGAWTITLSLNCNINVARNIAPRQVTLSGSSGTATIGASGNIRAGVCNFAGTGTSAFSVASGGSLRCDTSVCDAPTGTFYCSGNDRREYTGCSASDWTTSFVETCPSGTNFCSGGNRWTTNGCASGSCSSFVSQFCSGYYCVGSDRYQYTGCSSGSCTGSFVETCSLGCSGGVCTGGSPCGTQPGTFCFGFWCCEGTTWVCQASCSAES